MKSPVHLPSLQFLKLHGSLISPSCINFMSAKPLENGCGEMPIADSGDSNKVVVVVIGASFK